ncbi:RodZ domain-containing protein [Pleionea sediminis]|uniref:RodZ domain-containing protein n=1 Tax=Pleionea sediminis TaxID=2569479 RepID=UPI0011856701|nr:RodZ domain-containing protein [Pleionea sediminis]
MAVEQAIDTATKLEFGEQFKAARSAHKLTIEDAAKKLNLPVARIIEIEECNFDASISAAFYRGYIRSYASLLHLEPDVIVNAFNQASQGDTEITSPQRLQPFSASRNEVTTGSKLFKWISLIIVLVIILVVGWGIKQKFSGTDSLSSELLGENDSVDEEVNNESSATLSSSSQEQQDESSELAAPKRGTEASSFPLSGTQNQATGEEVLSEQQSSSGVSKIENFSNTQSAAPTEEDSNQSEVLQQNESGQDTTQQDTIQDQDELVLAFSGDCWVKIEDGTGQVLTQDLMKSGRTLRLSGVPPFKVLLGDPSVVSMQHNQNEFDLAKYSAGQVARFSID